MHVDAQYFDHCGVLGRRSNRPTPRIFINRIDVTLTNRQKHHRILVLLQPNHLANVRIETGEDYPSVAAVAKHNVQNGI